jgi:mono/diheme cytochrome c family protein
MLNIRARLAVRVHRIAAGVLAGILCFACIVRAESTRVADQLSVFYGGPQAEADSIQDASGVGAPLNLVIRTPKAVQWRDGVLCINSAAKVSSEQSAAKLIDAARESGALTVEVWIRPANDRQSGPARIISVSAGPSERNFTLAQDGDKYDFRLRTTERSANGVPSTATDAGAVRAGELTHLCATRTADGTVVIYIDGQAAARAAVGGDLSNWNEDYHLTLANETTGDRPWLGELHMTAVYSRALSDREVAQNFAAGVPGALDYEQLLPTASTRQVDFLTDVQPILRTHCFECHAAGNEEGGLNLGVRSRVLEGGESGRPLEPGDSTHSRLIHLVAGVREGQLMPPEGDRLTDEQIGILRAWIDQGALWPPGADVHDPRTERAREHWAFQPLRNVEPPPVGDQRWVRTPIDSFILASLKNRGLQPSPPIDPRRLIRRLNFDVVGLPPTVDEINAFIADYEADADAAVANLVERLLDSEHYGERWGRHWLDVARYADSCGQEGDQDRPHAYHYRNFVIRAFNDDLPWDTFVKWQLAGDEYEPDLSEAIAATGFLVGGTNTVLDKNKEYLEEELLRNRYNELDDIVATTGSAFLALTVGCARCHDHKYDAISAREYYRLLAAFHGGDRADVKLPDGREALVFAESGSTPAPTWLFERADFYDRDQPVNLGFIDVLLRGTASDEYWTEARDAMPDAPSTLQRRAMAEWMTDVEHGAGPLLARVIVNRVWQHHFGRGIVATPNDFGRMGALPTHPELLDWLALRFRDSDQSLKTLQRLATQAAAPADPHQ